MALGVDRSDEIKPFAWCQHRRFLGHCPFTKMYYCYHYYQWPGGHPLNCRLPLTHLGIGSKKLVIRQCLGKVRPGEELSISAVSKPQAPWTPDDSLYRIQGVYELGWENNWALSSFHLSMTFGISFHYERRQHTTVDEMYLPFCGQQKS